MSPKPRDHGGGIDRAARLYGGTRADWLDLSTGINPHPYPVESVDPSLWHALPDEGAQQALISAARQCWDVPDGREIVCAGGTSALIAALPGVLSGESFAAPGPTYNEHQAAFEAHGWRKRESTPDVLVIVHPNNPDGRFWESVPKAAKATIVDESFCDLAPERSFCRVYSPRKVNMENPASSDTYLDSGDQTTIILKSFGKFWGLAGLRLGFAITDPETAAKLKARIGPWPVSGPALKIAATALLDQAWAEAMRKRLAQDKARLDALMDKHGFASAGGTDLFGLFALPDAKAFQTALCNAKILVRTFPYSREWVRIGLPGDERSWDRLASALESYR